MEKVIEEIRENMDVLDIKHLLMPKMIQASPLLYIDIQRYIIEHVTGDSVICEFTYKEPITIDGIPVVINEDITGYDYEIVISIPSCRFRKGEK